MYKWALVETNNIFHRSTLWLPCKINRMFWNKHISFKLLFLSSALGKAYFEKAKFLFMKKAHELYFIMEKQNETLKAFFISLLACWNCASPVNHGKDLSVDSVWIFSISFSGSTGAFHDVVSGAFHDLVFCFVFLAFVCALKCYHI